MWPFLVLLLGGEVVVKEEPFKGFEEIPEVGPPPELRPVEAVQKEVPFVSVVGNITLALSGERWIPDRNKVVLERVELALQSWLYPSVRGEAFLSFRRKPGTGEVEVEVYEAYGRFLRLGRGLEGIAGRFRPAFGFVNRLHPHHRPFVDLPEVVGGLLGPEGLGAEGIWLKRSLGRASGEVGVWRPWTEAGALEFEGRVIYSLGLSASLEGVKASLHGFRRDGGGHMLWLGLWKEKALGDARWSIEGAYGRKPGGGFVRGLYAFVKRTAGRGWEIGLRGDYLREPAGERKGASLIALHRVSPTILLALQGKYTKSPTETGFEFLARLSWGIGPYAHPLSVAERVMESVPKEVPK